MKANEGGYANIMTGCQTFPIPAIPPPPMSDLITRSKIPRCRHRYTSKSNRVFKNVLNISPWDKLH